MIFRVYQKIASSRSPYITKKIRIRNRTLIIGLTPRICDANSTVNGFVTALEKPKPTAAMEIRNPVKES